MEVRWGNFAVISLKPAPGTDSPCQGEMSRSDRGDRERCPRRGRMRGQSKKQMSLEESCRAGACPRRLFLVYAGNFAACGRRGTFPAMGKHPKDCRGMPQRRTSFANDGLPPVPHYGGRVPESRQKISGAQNLSGFPQFNPAHWGLVFPKLKLMRFPFCAWLCRAGGGWCWAVGRGLLDAPLLDG